MSTKDIIEGIIALPEHEQWQVVMTVLQQLKDRDNYSMAVPAEAMSKEAFLERIKKAEDDIAAKRVYSTQEVRDNLQSWK